MIDDNKYNINLCSTVVRMSFFLKGHFTNFIHYCTVLSSGLPKPGLGEDIVLITLAFYLYRVQWESRQKMEKEKKVCMTCNKVPDWNQSSSSPATLMRIKKLGWIKCLNLKVTRAP